MKRRIEANGFSSKYSSFLTRAFIFAGILFCVVGARAQSPPNYPTNIALQSWSFYNPTTWQDDAGYAPVSFTNISESSMGYGPTLVVDTNIPAWLKYNVVENDETTNLTLNFGTTTFWFAPESWSSTNAGGVGPGEYGRLLEVGNYSANSSYGLWSIYVDSGGNNLYFSAQTNDLSSNLTTYVCAPISWTTNYFHFVALSYSSTNTTLYLDGVQATNGPGVTVYPGPNVLTNGFCIGSDTNGIYQAHGLFDLVQTYNYPLDSNDVQTLFSYYYSDFMIDPENIGYMDDFNLNYFSISTTTNLAISPLSISNNTASLFVVNSSADVVYEIQGCTNLAQPNWFTEAFVNGSELTNWTWANFYVSKQGDLFLRIRNWQDTTGTGIPDWWWLEYFGQTTNVNAYASDPPGDGYTDLQKYQMGLDPTNYYNPNPPGGFFGYLDPSGTNAFIVWNPAPGPVLNYAIRRGIQATNGAFVYSQIGLVNSNATFFEDVGSITNANSQNNIYTLTAVYPGSCYSGTDVWMVAWYTGYASDGPPYGPPLAQNAYAYADTTGTNILFSWTPPAGPATNCIIEHGIYNTTNSSYIYYPINHVSTNTTLYEAVGGLTNANNWKDDYGVIAVYPGGGLSALASSAISYIDGASIHVGSYSGPGAPTNFYGYYDSTGTNTFLHWNLSSGATNYIVWGGYYNGSINANAYHIIGRLGSTTNTFEVVGDTSDDVFALVAVYPGTNQSQAADWSLGYGAPAPGALYAYLDGTGTNVQLSWSAATGNITGYLVQRSDYGSGFYEVSQVGPNKTWLEDTDAVDTGYFDQSYTEYEVQAMYPNGGLSAAVTSMVNTTPLAPTGLAATLDSTGTNVLLSWNAPLGGVTNYNIIILRGIYNASTGTYTYSQIAELNDTTTSFEDAGAINGNNDNIVYELEAAAGGGELSSPDSAILTASPSSIYNIRLSAQVVRNQTGRWQVMFSAIPTNVTAVQLYIGPYVYDSIQNAVNAQNLGYYGNFNNQDLVDTVPVTSLTNGCLIIPDSIATNEIGDNAGGRGVGVQPIGTGGRVGQLTFAGLLSYDAPCFVDGREHLKQNLLFQLRAATISQPVGLSYNGVETFGDYISLQLPSTTNYVESSFFHWAEMFNSDGLAPEYIEMDDLWPFTVNYDFHSLLYDTNYTGPSSFVWQTNLLTVPASPVLGIGDPYWIFQNTGNLADLGITASGDPSGSVLTQQNGVYNLYGLEFGTARLISAYDLGTGNPIDGPWLLPPGTPVAINPYGTEGFYTFYSQTVDPDLVFTNYYFAVVNTPGSALPGDTSPNQSEPVPVPAGFANTNQTSLMVASVGAPAVVGGWAKFAISNGSANKSAYLGQYYLTNAFVVTNGVVTTNATGVVSPYGDFFPTQAGQAALITMPDPDGEYRQGTGVVDVISLNVDANHDGTMNLTYGGPDFVSASNPFRFWANDDQDAYDDYGDGIPGYQPSYDQDGYATAGDTPYSTLPMLPPVPGGFIVEPFYQVHGTRDLVDYFPVYLNIGSLFQSNALNSGINITDPSYQFILSQADGALRFVYTALTPTNYMNFLRDTNEAELLSVADAFPIDPRGNPLSSAFIAAVATNNEGIILVEAATNTTQPLVLTIYHGTNQIGQTSLPLSISGVEQMFRHKNILLDSDPSAVPDRLTDASVPNEPNTTDINFVFLHGYNVNPQQARGWDADFYKRIYWSGSHAKFYGVTWEGSDSQILGEVTVNLQTNIVHAFNTAPLLNEFLDSLPGTNVVAAHSLGNMVVLSTLNDYSNQTINTYFMIDAAVAVEALQGNATPDVNMYSTNWIPYADKLNASHWWQLWSTNDNRSALTWNNRFSNLQNANVYNFYSSGEEVLREYSNANGDPPSELLGSLYQVKYYLFTTMLNEGLPTGDYTWAWQELLKGRGEYDWLISSTHGGWKFNTNSPYAYATNGVITQIADSQATLIPTSQLQTNAFFNVTSTNFGNSDLALFGSSGSTYAQANRNRILSDAIPCLTLPAGANPVPILGATHNFNMTTNTFENSWPEVRLRNSTEQSNWHHSDCRQIAYTFTHNLFDDMVMFGDLK